MKEQKSEGYCIYCNELILKQEIGKHLSKHLSGFEKTANADGAVNYCHIEVESEELFLHLLVKGDAKMKVIDNFLKDIWLECCGHMSAFGHKNFRVSMSHLVEDVMEPRIKIFHDYDFGSTTRVFLKGLKHYRLDQKERLILLSRNEPLKIPCTHCKKKAASYLCVECYEGDDYSYYCEKCSVLHEKECDAYGDYAQMLVVNSPRMGVCGYEGGSIDLDRDRIRLKK
ncbi:MAG: hypothetical protein Q8T08_12070 [Ignavibacteria bacterium]|nr:hypothetical protein [Ignavibacteria bacterium]